MEQVREDIYLRDPKLAFKNATGLKVMMKPQDYMYMYTRRSSRAPRRPRYMYMHRCVRIAFWGILSTGGY